EAPPLDAHRPLLGRDAPLTSTAVTSAGQVVRIAPCAGFSDQGGTVTPNGLYYADDAQHIEHRLLVDHSVPNCKSEILYKGALQSEERRVGKECRSGGSGGHRRQKAKGEVRGHCVDKYECEERV